MWNLRKTEEEKKKKASLQIQRRDCGLPEVGSGEWIKQVNGIKRFTNAVTFQTNKSLKCNVQHLDYS